MNAETQALRALVADDEVPARKRLRELLDDCRTQVPVDVVAEAGNGLEALARIGDAAVDVAFLDIRMPEMDGLEAARHMQKLPTPPRIVFTTAYDTYAVSAFELHAIDYLLKPVRAARLLQSLERLRSMPPLQPEVLERAAQAARTHFSLQERGRIRLVPVSDVLYLRSELKYVTVRTRDREYLIEESLTRLEQEFDRLFVRIHRNCLVAKAHLAGFERAADEGGEARWAAMLLGLDERLPVSRRQAHVIRDFGKPAA